MGTNLIVIKPSESQLNLEVIATMSSLTKYSVVRRHQAVNLVHNKIIRTKITKVFFNGSAEDA